MCRRGRSLRNACWSRTACADSLWRVLPMGGRQLQRGVHSPQQRERRERCHVASRIVDCLASDDRCTRSRSDDTSRIELIISESHNSMQWNAMCVCLWCWIIAQSWAQSSALFWSSASSHPCLSGNFSRSAQRSKQYNDEDFTSLTDKKSKIPAPTANLPKATFSCIKIPRAPRQHPTRDSSSDTLKAIIMHVHAQWLFTFPLYSSVCSLLVPSLWEVIPPL